MSHVKKQCGEDAQPQIDLQLIAMTLYEYSSFQAINGRDLLTSVAADLGLYGKRKLSRTYIHASLMRHRWVYLFTEKRANGLLSPSAPAESGKGSTRITSGRTRRCELLRGLSCRGEASQQGSRQHRSWYPNRIYQRLE